MMTGKDRAGQIVERAVTHLAGIALTVRLSLVMPVFNHLGGVTVWTFNAFRPAEVPNHSIALGIINQSVNVHSHPAAKKIRLDYLGKLDQSQKV